MSSDSTATIPRGAPMGLPVRGIRAVVVEGADAGKTVTAEEVLTIGAADGNDLVLKDRMVSRCHAELRRRGNRIVLTDLGSTNGTTVGSVCLEDSHAILTPGTTVMVGESRLRVEDEEDVVMIGLHGSRALGGLWGASPAMRRLMATIERLADSDVTLMLLGESGTGKEVCARTVHELGTRRAAPFVTVDCGAIPPSLFASELFGHEKGAFTNAEGRHAGAFERASSGTLFLDEVGELPPEIQVGLLGALERRTVRRIGGRDEIPVDVRVIAATARDLRSEVNSGGFRLDLYYRLAVVTLEVPPLRERTDDIPILVEHFLREEGYGGAGAVEAVFSAEDMHRLAQHRWPGNVRELRNVVLATLAMGESPELDAEARAAPDGGPDPFEAVLDLTYKEARSKIVRQFEARYLENLLARTGGNIRQAAREAKMDRSYMMELLSRHGLR